MRLFLYRNCARQVSFAFKSIFLSFSKELHFQASLVTWILHRFNQWEALEETREQKERTQELGRSQGSFPSLALLHAVYPAMAGLPCKSRFRHVPATVLTPWRWPCFLGSGSTSAFHCLSRLTSEHRFLLLLIFWVHPPPLFGFSDLPLPRNKFPEIKLPLLKDLEWSSDWNITHKLS